MTDQQATRALVIGALGLLLTACSGQPTSGGTGPTTTQPSFNRATSTTTTATAPAPPPPAAPITDPVAAAKQWLISYRSLTWTDPKPSAWIDRIRPAITDRLAADYDQLRTGSGGADWTTFVQRRCTSEVKDVDGTKPSENPGTDVSATILVSGQVTTTCTAGEPTTPSTKFSATLTVVKGTDGGWWVDRQVY